MVEHLKRVLMLQRSSIVCRYKPRKFITMILAEHADRKPNLFQIADAIDAGTAIASGSGEKWQQHEHQAQCRQDDEQVYQRESVECSGGGFHGIAKRMGKSLVYRIRFWRACSATCCALPSAKARFKLPP